MTQGFGSTPRPCLLMLAARRPILPTAWKARCLCTSHLPRPRDITNLPAADRKYMSACDIVRLPSPSDITPKTCVTLALNAHKVGRIDPQSADRGHALRLTSQLPKLQARAQYLQ